jgi:hypothetical protein
MLSDADHCRIRAEQCRRLAGDALRPATRASFLDLARDYEQMAALKSPRRSYFGLSTFTHDRHRPEL